MMAMPHSLSSAEIVVEQPARLLLLHEKVFPRSFLQSLGHDVSSYESLADGPDSTPLQ